MFSELKQRGSNVVLSLFMGVVKVLKAPLGTMKKVSMAKRLFRR